MQISSTTDSAIASSSSRSFQSNCCLTDVDLTLQPHGALVVPWSACSGLALVPGGAACVVIRQRKQQQGVDVAVLCSVCPSFSSNVTCVVFHYTSYSHANHYVSPNRLSSHSFSAPSFDHNSCNPVSAAIRLPPPNYHSALPSSSQRGINTRSCHGFTSSMFDRAFN
jgi:hypothetical protein